MFNVFRTLIVGASARAEEKVTDAFAIDLIEQKIREAEAGLTGAKQTLAALIMRQRTEQQALDRLQARLADLEARVRQALTAGREDLAAQGATAMAELENERAVRRDTLESISSRIEKTRLSVEKANRRIIDLKQGMISARAADAERRAQRGLDRSLNGGAAVREAEALIARVLGGPDPFAESEVLDEIDASLDGTTARDNLARAGFGDKLKVDADDILARLKKSTDNA